MGESRRTSRWRVPVLLLATVLPVTAAMSGAGCNWEPGTLKVTDPHRTVEDPGTGADSGGSTDGDGDYPIDPGWPDPGGDYVEPDGGGAVEPDPGEDYVEPDPGGDYEDDFGDYSDPDF